MVDATPVGPLLFMEPQITKPFLGSWPPIVSNQLLPKLGERHKPAVSLALTIPMLPRPIQTFSSSNDNLSITTSVTEASAVPAARAVPLSRNILVGSVTLVQVAPPSVER